MSSAITSFDTQTFNGPGDDYVLRYDGRNLADWDLEVEIRERVNQFGRRELVRIPPREIPLVATVSDAALAAAGSLDEIRNQFNDDMYALFVPFGGERALSSTITRGDGSTVDCYLMCDVISVSTPKATNRPYFFVLLHAADPYYKSVATSTSLTNDGQLEAIPTLAIAGGTACTRERWSISDPTGRGLAGHPVKFTSSFGANDWVFDRGRPVPTVGAWARVDVLPGQATILDVYRSTGISNPLSGSLELGGLDESSTNAQWTIDLASVHQAPNAPGSFHYRTTGQIFSNVSYGPNPSGPNFALSPDNQYANTADSIVVNTGVGADQISGVILTLSGGYSAEEELDVDGNPTGDNFYTDAARIFVRERAYGQKLYTDVETAQHGANPAVATGTAPVDVTIDTTTPLALSDAYNIALGIEALTNLGDGELAITGTAVIDLSSTVTPALVGSVSARALSDETITIDGNGDSVRLVQAFRDDVDLEIDSYNRVIAPASGPLYVGDVLWSNPADWFRLPAGANTISVGSTTVTVEYEERYITAT